MDKVVRKAATEGDAHAFACRIVNQRGATEGNLLTVLLTTARGIIVGKPARKPTGIKDTSDVKQREIIGTVTQVLGPWQRSGRGIVRPPNLHFQLGTGNGRGITGHRGKRGDEVAMGVHIPGAMCGRAHNAQCEMVPQVPVAWGKVTAPLCTTRREAAAPNVTAVRV